MVLEVRRTIRERAKLFVIAWLFGAGGTVVVFARSGGNFPVGGAEAAFVLAVVFGLASAFIIDRVVGASIQAFRVARLGSAEERSALLEKAGQAESDSAAVALVAAEHRSLSEMAAILARCSGHRGRTTVEELAQLRYRLAFESNASRAELVREILDWRPSTFGAHALELERYAAFVVAMHVDRDVSDRTLSIARRLLAHRDEQVRGYGTWLALEIGIEDLPNRASASGDFAVGAALAKHHGRAELAALLDARASKLATGAAPSAYRD